MPRVSVVMPVYNGERYLHEAIDSILNQTFSDFEFIVINDCSDDGTENIIKSYTDSRIHYIKNENNLGVALSLNRGFDAAKGEYIARMDADDISLPSRLEKQVEYMEDNPAIAVCGCETELFGDVEKTDTYTVFGKEMMKINLLFAPCLCHPAVMLRRSVVEKEHYRYDDSFERLEDYELWTRLFLKYDIDNVRGVYFKYRLHSKQVTQNYSENHMQTLNRIRHNMMSALGVDLSSDEFRAYSDYCSGSFNSGSELIDLASAFEKLSKTNKRTGFFDRNMLKSYLEGILINAFCGQSDVAFNEIKQVCGLVSYKELAKCRVKQKVKRIIYKEKE